MKQVDEARSQMRAARLKLEEANGKLLALAGPIDVPPASVTPVMFARVARQQLGEATARINRLVST